MVHGEKRYLPPVFHPYIKLKLGAESLVLTQIQGEYSPFFQWS
jgi:hypothetical protein